MRISALVICAVWLGSATASPVLAGDAGQAIYETHCSACHGDNGKGAIPGTPDFTQKGGVLSLSDAVLIGRITNGYQGPNSPMAMPAKGGDSSLTGQQIKQVLAYIRSKFGA